MKKTTFENKNIALLASQYLDMNIQPFSSNVLNNVIISTSRMCVECPSAVAEILVAWGGGDGLRPPNQRSCRKIQPFAG